MIVGIPKEVKDNEFRVSLPPGGVATLTHSGHKVLVQAGAGVGSGFSDDEYAARGAIIVEEAAKVWADSEMIVKVKEPIESEFPFLRENLLLFTYLHLAACEDLTYELLKKKVTSIAYETVALDNRHLPLLIPMSEVAGRMAVQVGAHYLEKENGGRGKLLGGVPGVRPSEVVIIGGGTAGTNSAQMALGMGAQVTIIDRDLERLRYLSETLHGNLITLASNPFNIARCVKYADLLIGTVLIPGARAPKLVTSEMIATMNPGSVIVDVAIDQGGCMETSQPTSHSNPTYEIDGVIHYAVTNIPGAVPRTSTYALSNATLPYAVLLADKGFEGAIKASRPLARGVNTYQGKIAYEAVADCFDLPYVPLEL